MSLALSRGRALLFPAALGISAAVHLLLLFLWPYSPARPAQQPPEPIPVRLVQAPRPTAPPALQAARQPATAPERENVRVAAVPLREATQPAAPGPAAEPEARQPAPETPLELAPPASPPATPAAYGEAAGQAAGPQTAAPGSQTGSGPGASAEAAAEVAATQAVLSSLRARIVEKIRYPALARANGWKGTVLMELLLDEKGALQALAVRRSSGYAVLDRAASALVRSVTPVSNPLGRPLRIEVPIAYELRD